MKIHHLRNATFVMESKNQFILVDPMLGKEGSLPPFSKKRHEPKRNPTKPLPKNADSILSSVNHCLITHSHTFGLQALQHTDHLDAAGERLLIENNIPVTCRSKDVSYLRKKKMNIHAGVKPWETTPFLGGKITAIPATHGHGWITNLMANGVGFFVELPGEPSIYISGDTVFTSDVDRALTELKPDIAVMASGSATVDFGGPILMPLEELITFAQKAPNKVIANHMEALNHCPTTRDQLRSELKVNGLLEKTMIPEDGDTLQI